jgi:lactoylglutathione lyase
MKNLGSVLLASLAALLAAVSLAAAQSAPDESKKPEFDHTTVFVRDAAKSAAFYEKILGLERIPDPFKDATHVWLRAGAHQQLHVVGGATEAARHEMEAHFAFRVASVEAFAKHLDQMGVEYRALHGGEKQIQVRPDGVHQIYFHDPDGYWIEVNDDRF